MTPGASETEALVARGLLRPGEGGKGFVFQLHPQGYKFEEGHIAKLELLPSDAPYSRQPNAQAPVEISNLELRLPVREKPGSGGGFVQEPKPVVIPDGFEPAIDCQRPRRWAPASRARPLPWEWPASAKGKIRATKKRLILRLNCKGGPCSGTLTVKQGQAQPSPAAPTAIPGGPDAASLRLPLTKAGKKFVAHGARKGKKKKLRRPPRLHRRRPPGAFALKRPVRLKKKRG